MAEEEGAEVAGPWADEAAGAGEAVDCILWSLPAARGTGAAAKGAERLSALAASAAAVG